MVASTGSDMLGTLTAFALTPGFIDVYHQIPRILSD